MNKIFKISALALALSTFSGCGESPDVVKMKGGLMRSGMSDAEATYVAETMSKSVDAEQFNYAAALMAAGIDEKSAFNKTRRKFGEDYDREAIKEAKESYQNKK